MDPIRSKVRVLSKNRIKFVIQGKNAAYWWKTGKEMMSRNDITAALKCFENGLSLDPTNFFNRFSHGMICFKLGLIQEAKNDYLMASILYPKELFAHYNLAICFNQLGEYKQSIQAVDKVLVHTIKAISQL